MKMDNSATVKPTENNIQSAKLTSTDAEVPTDKCEGNINNNANDKISVRDSQTSLWSNENLIDKITQNIQDSVNHDDTQNRPDQSITTGLILVMVKCNMKLLTCYVFYVIISEILHSLFT